jgi:hypothetical protein
MITVELTGDTADLFDPEFVREAAAAVFHYFRVDLCRDSVSVAEFTMALEKVLRGFRLESQKPGAAAEADPTPRVAQSDLVRLAAESGSELFFYSRLRSELRTQLEQSPQMLCFEGLRNCVKKLRGVRRWNQHCQALQDEIVEYLRNCLTHETEGTSCALVVR